jgi:glycosyltransferase involved in cell wall biosynthesis
MQAPDNALVFASLGQVTPHKQMELALHAFKQLRQTHPHGRYLIVGEITPESGLDALIARLELEDTVYATGHVPHLADFVNWLLLADVVINLRHPTLGETSAVALRAMGAGKPLIVFDQGWYSELPDSAARKIAPMDEAALLEAMRQLADEPELRQEMGRAAQQTVLEQCAPDKVAAAYLAFIRQLMAHYGGTHA